MKQILSTNKILLSVLILFFILFTTISLHRYWQYAAWYYDFGIFYTAIAAVAQGKAPIIDHFVFTDQNILGDHFHPLIFTISPFVALFKRGEVLLIFQSLFVTLSGFFMYLTTQKIVKSKLESLLFLCIYFSFIGLHNAVITEFHEVVLATLPIAIFFYGMVAKKKYWYVLGLLGTLLAKETLFIIPIWFGMVLIFKNKGLWRKIGLGTVLFSIAYTILIIFLVIPAINGSGYYYAPTRLPLEEYLLFFTRKNILVVFKTVLSFGFLPLFSPETMVPVVFNWWTRFSRFGELDLGMQYNAEITPTLLLSAVFGWKRLTEYVKKHFKTIRQKTLRYGLLLLTGFLVFYSIWILKSPALLMTNTAFFAHSKNFSFLDTLIEHIPDDGVVMAQTNIAAKIAYRKVYMLRDNYEDFNPDYIVIDTRDGQGGNIFIGISDFSALVARLEVDPLYEVYYEQSEQFIYRKK